MNIAVGLSGILISSAFPYPTPSNWSRKEGGRQGMTGRSHVHRTGTRAISTRQCIPSSSGARLVVAFPIEMERLIEGRHRLLHFVCGESPGRLDLGILWRVAVSLNDEAANGFTAQRPLIGELGQLGSERGMGDVLARTRNLKGHEHTDELAVIAVKVSALDKTRPQAWPLILDLLKVLLTPKPLDPNAVQPCFNTNVDRVCRERSGSSSPADRYLSVSVAPRP
jgi:hypothetical protein